MSTAEDKPTMHCHDELERDLSYPDWIPDTTIMKWFNEGYSTSKHLWTLYTIVKGLNAQRILEIGFGRSTFVLARAANENHTKLISCDTRDFTYLLNESERAVVDARVCLSDEIFANETEGFDFILLDFLGDNPSPKFCRKQLLQALPYLKQNGILVVHDAFCPRFDLPPVLHKVFHGIGSRALRSDYQMTVLPYNYGLGIIRRHGASPYGVIEDVFEKKDGEI